MINFCYFKIKNNKINFVNFFYINNNLQLWLLQNSKNMSLIIEKTEQKPSPSLNLS
jgi:hypothetical protein